MKILIFECWHESPQYETGLEIAEKHAEKNDEVTYINIGRELPFLEWHLFNQNNFKNKILNYFNHRKKYKLTKSVLNKEIKYHTTSLLKKDVKKALYEERTFSNINELKKYYWKNIDIGMAVASSLISITNDLNPETKYEHAENIKNLIHAAKLAGLSFNTWLDKIKPDLVYFRNGRVAVYRPILRICQQRGQNFKIHDRGCNKNHYVISPDLRHNFDMIHEQIQEAWNAEHDYKKKIKIANNFYADRRAGKEQAWKAFLDKQKNATLPAKWDENKYNIVFYNSSISEYAAISSEHNPNILFNSQIDAIYYIANIIKIMKNTDFYIRLHPNLLNQSQKEKSLWLNLNHPVINIISPDSRVDTYELMEHSDLVIAYMSTTGIEAAYYGKPVIILAKSMYYKLGSVYFPENLVELKDMIQSKKLKPKNIDGAIKYGYYMNTYGYKYHFFKPYSFLEGEFKGVNLQRKPLLLDFASRLKHKIRRVVNYLK